MASQRYPETFKIEAVKQITAGGRWLTLHEPSGYPATACMHGSVSPLTSSTKSQPCKPRSAV
jgi:hypothetical protein